MSRKNEAGPMGFEPSRCLAKDPDHYTNELTGLIPAYIGNPARIPTRLDGLDG
jgi:hypothetical protein